MAYGAPCGGSGRYAHVTRRVEPVATNFSSCAPRARNRASIPSAAPETGEPGIENVSAQNY
eukprot:6386136-Prymnesium_polylepis.1